MNLLCYSLEDLLDVVQHYLPFQDIFQLPGHLLFNTVAAKHHNSLCRWVRTIKESSRILFTWNKSSLFYSKKGQFAIRNSQNTAGISISLFPKSEIQVMYSPLCDFYVAKINCIFHDLDAFAEGCLLEGY